MVFTFHTLRDWKNTISYARRDSKGDEVENIVDVVFTNTLRNIDDFRSLIPRFMSRMNADIVFKGEHECLQDSKASRLTTEPTEKPGLGAAAPHISEGQDGIEARPKLTPKGLLNKLGGLERKVSQRLSRNKRATACEEKEGPDRGQKRNRDAADMDMTTDDAESEGHWAKKRPVCKLGLMCTLHPATVIDTVQRRIGRAAMEMEMELEVDVDVEVEMVVWGCRQAS
jgi:hypothetical protein